MSIAPGIAGRTEHRVERVTGPTELGRVGLADHHGAGVDEPPDDQAACRRCRSIGQGQASTGGGEAGRVLEVLHPDRYAGEDSWIDAGGHPGVDSRRRFQRRFGIHNHESIQLTVERFDSRQRKLHELTGSQLPRPDLLSETLDGLRAKVHRVTVCGEASDRLYFGVVQDFEAERTAGDQAGLGGEGQPSPPPDDRSSSSDSVEHTEDDEVGSPVPEDGFDLVYGEVKAGPEILHNALPTRIEAWRRRSTMGAVLTGFALGLKEALEPRKNEPAVILETSGEPPEDLPVEAQLEKLIPSQTVVKVRPWLLGGADPASKTEADAAADSVVDEGPAHPVLDRPSPGSAP
jgi:hypothetical protein